MIDFNDGVFRLMRDETRLAAKPHACGLCAKHIHKRTDHHVRTGVYYEDDEIVSHHFHPRCLEVAQTVYTESQDIIEHSINDFRYLLDFHESLIN